MSARLATLAAGAAAAAAGVLALLAEWDAIPLRWPVAAPVACALAGLVLVARSEPPPHGGLYAGVIARSGRPRWAWRAVVLCGGAVYGAGVVAYAVAALAQSLRSRQAREDAIEWRRSVGTGLCGLGVVLAADELGVAAGGTALWAVCLAGAGLSLFWWSGRTVGGDTEDGTKENEFNRVLVALTLAVTGAGVSVRAIHLGHQTAGSLAGALGVVGILGLVVGPRWLRTSRLLAVEREARARAQERAELADHLHDSVLQTLALIRRRADDPAEVSALARRQERELRAWLQGRPAEATPRTVAAALQRAAGDVEDTHRVAVDVVTVGDAPLDDRTEALVAAAREALTNAAKHAGGAAVSLFAEIADGRVVAYVRDRGPGFDPEAVPDDRHGVRESIVGRMRRHGGHAEVRSAPGEGCEVELVAETRR